MKTYAALCVCLLALPALAQVQSTPSPKPRSSPAESHPCLIVARYGMDGLFAYRDEYGVPSEEVQPTYNGDELNGIMKSGIKVVVYDPREHEWFAEARESCFYPSSQAPAR